MKYAPLSLTKFDSAERQLLQAIRMFFNDQDIVSIHTLAEAASQVFGDIGKDDGVKSMIRDSDRIRPEHRKEWVKAVNSARNFFKHADNDRDGIYTFKEMMNHTSILDGMLMHQRLKPGWVPETILFYLWFSLEHPEMLEAEPELLSVRDKLRWEDKPLDASSRASFAQMVDEIRKSGSSIPGVSTYYGQLKKP